MQFVGDAVMAVFGAPFPQPDHADRAVAAAAAMHSLQAEINARWAADGLEPFGLGIGLSTGEAAAACSARRSGWSTPWSVTRSTCPSGCSSSPQAGETVLSEGTSQALSLPADTIALPAQLVKGRDTPITAYKLAAPGDPVPVREPDHNPMTTRGGR